MAFFGRKKPGSGDSHAGDNGDSSGNGDSRAFNHDLKKANKWYEFGSAAADARNYDYAVECYVNGLKFDADNLSKHEMLREISLKRKVAQGKPQKVKPTGKDALSRMLDAEKTLAMDPLNIKHMVTLLERIADFQDDYDDMNLGDFAETVGRQAVEFNAGSKKPNKNTYLDICDALRRVGGYEISCQAARMALSLDPQDNTLLNLLRDIETEWAQEKMNLGGEEGYRGSIKEDQGEDLIAPGEEGKRQIIAMRRREFEDNRDEIELRLKLIDALRNMETEEYENEAVELLKEVYETSRQYRHRVMMGDIWLKQFARRLRDAKKAYEADTSDEKAKAIYVEASTKLLQLRLQEFAARVKEYPTDMSVRYEFGRTLFQARKFDEAIAALQMSKADAKYRASSHELLGRAYIEKGWLDLAIDTLGEGIRQYQLTDDKMALALRYHKMEAHEKKARDEGSLEDGQHAMKHASEIIQNDINFRDFPGRMDVIKQLVSELRERIAG